MIFLSGQHVYSSFLYIRKSPIAFLNDLEFPLFLHIYFNVHFDIYTWQINTYFLRLQFKQSQNMFQKSVNLLFVLRRYFSISDSFEINFATFFSCMNGFAYFGKYIDAFKHFYLRFLYQKF